MRKFAALMVFASAVSCTSAPKNTDFAKKAFEAWAKAAVEGDAEKTLEGHTDANLCDWIYNRLEENDGLATRWRTGLTGRARTDLDLWWGVSRKHGNGRTELLGASVLQHPSFRQLFRDHYLQALSEVKATFSKLEITQSWGDDSGVTLVVKLNGGVYMMYGMAFERSTWKIDTLKEGTGQGN